MALMSIRREDDQQGKSACLGAGRIGRIHGGNIAAHPRARAAGGGGRRGARRRRSARRGAANAA